MSTQNFFRNLMGVFMLIMTPVVFSIPLPEKTHLVSVAPAFNPSDINPYDNYKWSSNNE